MNNKFCYLNYSNNSDLKRWTYKILLSCTANPLFPDKTHYFASGQIFSARWNLYILDNEIPQTIESISSSAGEVTYFSRIKQMKHETQVKG